MMFVKKTSHVRLKFFGLLFAILFAAIANIGCSSGGDGGGGSAAPTTPTYTGERTQANINEQNAENITESAFESYNSASGLKHVMEYEDNSGGISMPFSLALHDLLLRSVNHTDANLTYNRVALSEVNETEGGSCGGTFDIYINVDDQTGDFTGNVNFNSFCEDGTTISGPANISGGVNSISNFEIQFEFGLMTTTYNGVSTSMTGDINFTQYGSTDTMVMDLVMKDNSSSKTFMYEGYTTAVTQGYGYFQFTISGRFYHPDYGYVNITTTEPFRINSDDTWPSSGIMRVEGEAGSAGGNTMSQLTVIDSSYYEIASDTDGDGTFDWQSGQLSW